MANIPKPPFTPKDAGAFQGNGYQRTQANRDKYNVLDWIDENVEVGMTFTIKEMPKKYHKNGESSGSWQLTGYYTHSFKVVGLHPNYADCVYLTDPFMGDHRGFTYAELYDICHTGLAKITTNTREMEAV